MVLCLIGVGKIPRENNGHHFFLAIPFRGIVQSQPAASNSLIVGGTHIRDCGFFVSTV